MNRELRSTITGEGRLELELAEVPVPPPRAGEVTVQVEATPINPSDLGLLLGPADLATLEIGKDGRLSASVPAAAMPGMASRLDQPMPVGNEGAGTVVDAGPGCEDWIGKKVGMWGGGMYAQLRTLPAHACAVLPDHATAADGASMFINPLTALGFVETMRAEGHTAIVHTAAASNLGQMLNRICRKDGIALVNIVRSPAQVQLLREGGAAIVIDSSAANYETALIDAIAATGATLAFDAIGGGVQVARILAAMEVVAARRLTAFSRYGSDTLKQVYSYGVLDTSPIVLDRWVGFAWSVSGWLLTHFLARHDQDMARLRQRVLDELTTTFASHYTATISLAEALDPDILRAYARRSTGEKYLIDPRR